jgi:hypothetical protein
MCHDAVLLGQSHINQLAEIISPNKIQALLELGIKATTKTILFLSIIVCMITCILAQIIKSLCILQYCVRTLGKCQEFINFHSSNPSGI